MLERMHELRSIASWGYEFGPGPRLGRNKNHSPHVYASRSIACQERVLNRNNRLYLVIGALLVVVVGLGAYIVHEETKPDGIEMRIGENGVSIKEN